MNTKKRCGYTISTAFIKMKVDITDNNYDIDTRLNKQSRIAFEKIKLTFNTMQQNAYDTFKFISHSIWIMKNLSTNYFFVQR